MNVPGGVPQRELTIEACQRACEQTIYCVGVDIDPDPATAFCWLTVPPMAGGPIQAFIGVTHYALVRNENCTFAGLSPETRTTTPSTTVTTTTAMPSSTIPPPCFVKLLVDANSDGGALLGIMPEQSCVQQCLDRHPDCVAVDYRTSDQNCYWHDVGSGVQWNDCCNRYQISCEPTCEDSLVLFENLAATIAGQTPPATGVRTVDECKARCLQDERCAGFNWMRDGRNDTDKCLLYNVLIGDTTELNLFDLYVRERCQPNMFITFGPVTSPRTPPPGFCVLDIVLVVDTSSSIREEQPPGVDNVQLIKSFLGQLLSPPIDVGLHFDHVAMVTYDASARIHFDLSERTTLDDVMRGINSMPVLHGETNTPDGINLGLQVLRGAHLGARPDAKKVMVLLTDGQTTDRWDPNYLPVVSRLNQTDILRIAIGVTEKIDHEQLMAFASDPRYVAEIQSFSELGTTTPMVQNAMLALCGRANFTLTVPPVTAEPASPLLSTTPDRSTPPPSPAFEVVFQFASSSSYSTTGSVVPLDTEVVNPARRYRNSTFVSTVEGIHFVEECVGVAAGSTSRVKINGGAPLVGFFWSSNDQNGVTGGCRAMLMYFARGVRLNLYLEEGSTYSDPTYQLTSLSVFSVEDAMVSSAASSALLATTSEPANTTLVNYAIPFQNPVITPTIPGTYSAATYTYTCTQTGPYLFSVSAAVPAGQRALVSLEGVASFFPTMLRSVGAYNGMTTLSRSYLLQCSANTRVRAVLSYGRLNTGPADYNLLTFLVVPYQPRSVTATSWAVYRSTVADASSRAIDPMTFDEVNVNQGSLYNSNNGIVTISTSGYYYLYISAGADERQSTYMSVKRTRQGQKVTLFAIYRTATRADGIETLGHGSLQLLEAGDQLNVAAERGYSIYSDADYATSFFGILLYRA